MERRFLIHKSGDTFILADKTDVGMGAQMVPSRDFNSWEHLYAWCTAHGATAESLIQVANNLKAANSSEIVISNIQDE